MNIRAICLASVCAVGLTTAAGASSVDYNFEFDPVEEGSPGNIEGVLSFSGPVEGVSNLKPDAVYVTQSDIGGIGEYDTASANEDEDEDGFDFNSSGDIIGSDYTVSRVEGEAEEQLTFTLGFSSSDPELYILGCTSVLEAADCVDNQFAAGRVRSSVRITYTRIEDVAGDSSISVMPVPAGLPLMLAGLAGLAVVRGRRKKA